MPSSPLSSIKTPLSAVNLNQQRVLVRLDLNVPLSEAGEILDDTRIRAALPTIQQLVTQNAAVILVSHLGRPNGVDERFSLAPVAKALSKELGQRVPLVPLECLPATPAPGECCLLENIRFDARETQNDKAFAKSLAAMADYFVMDAFAVAHRAHASTAGVAAIMADRSLGPLTLSELSHLERFQAADRPHWAIVGGAKISTKASLVASLAKQMDGIVLGGGMANTFLKVMGVHIGASLYEPDALSLVETLMQTLTQADCQLCLPSDGIVLNRTTNAVRYSDFTEILPDEAIMDIGAQSLHLFADKLQSAGAIFWNGPMGVFEDPRFANGTKELINRLKSCAGFTLAGGGDTLAALSQLSKLDAVDAFSTGGGAFLALLEGSEMPGIAPFTAQ